MSENWVEGSYESGADEDSGALAPSTPTEEGTGATMGAGEPSTFEPEEDSGEGGDESKAGS